MSRKPSTDRRPTGSKSPGRRAPSEELLGQALDRTLLKRIFGFVWPYKKELIIAVALLPVISLLRDRAAVPA